MAFNVLEWFSWFDGKGTVAAAIGSSAGAIAAFQVERWQRSRNDREREIEAGNRALLEILQMRALITGMQKAGVAKGRDRDYRWLAIPALHGADVVPSVSVESLMFLRRARNSRLLHDLSTLNYNIAHMQSFVKLRSAHYVEKIQPMLNGLLTASGDLNLLEYAKHKDSMDMRACVEQTDAMIQFIDKNWVDSEARFVELRGELKYLFPRAKFFRIDFEAERQAIDALRMPAPNATGGQV